MNGREDKKSNHLFFLCSLIEYIGRKTKNHRSVVVNALGREKLQHIFDLADVYHSENIEKVAFDLVKTHHIEERTFDNISNAKYSIPTYWDIGKVYKNLILSVSVNQNKHIIDALLEIYNSWLSRKIEDFNSSVYYENPDYLYESYLTGDVL